jgi:GGDEF domain-containing protein
LDRRTGSGELIEPGMGPLLSVSVGVGVYPHDGEKIEALLRKADVAMYLLRAKKREPLDTD